MPDPSDPKAHAHPFTRPASDASERAHDAKNRRTQHRDHTPRYAELCVTSNFTFLRGASHPDEFVREAAELGYAAIAITDHNSLAGIVRAHVAAKEAGIPLIVGCRLRFVADYKNALRLGNDDASEDDASKGDASEGDASEGDASNVTPLPLGGGRGRVSREKAANPDQAPRGIPPHPASPPRGRGVTPSASQRDMARTSPMAGLNTHHSSADFSILVYPTTRTAYGRLCTMLTRGKRRTTKGECLLTLDDLLDHHPDLLAVALPPATIDDDYVAILRALKRTFDDDRLSLAIMRTYAPDSEACIRRTTAIARRLHIPLVAVNDAHYHIPERRPLQDVLTCIRAGCSIGDAGFRLLPNGERHLKPPAEMVRLFADLPHAIARTRAIAERATAFNLDELRYEYPDEVCPPGLSPMAYLEQLTWEGAARRYPDGVPEKVKAQIRYEFQLIDELSYAPYFLTVHDIVAFANSQGILCQGRGAAANSAVCYCLGVTAVDPDRVNVLFERFVSHERNEPPDIDIDFEHERREEVIQYLYDKYGRDRASLTAEVITYRRRSAVRDVGKALGFSLDAVDRIAKRVDSWEHNPFADSASGDVPAQLVALGFDANDTTVQLFVKLVRELVGFPRHLSQHVGGFVITRGPLCELVPIENAAMPDRTVIEWDKDDIDAMGMLKVDVLGLGMLTCIRKALELITQHHDRPLSLATIPPEEPEVYDMLCDADTLGVFQVESRAQMTMLPRLKPRCYYDLVIEVAIVRPGPIIGQMVHPYLRRRDGDEPAHYPSAVVRSVLGRTLGVPLFQEQVMALAVQAARFTPGEAEQLRRAITAWTSKDKIIRYSTNFIRGMLTNGYSREFAEWCFQRMRGFSQYGFPESHAASFALLVYSSSWIKCHYPAVFAAALLNSQPLGFYAPAQIVRDARDHGVEVRAVDVNRSAWDCTLEDGGKVLRLGMRMVKGLKQRDGLAIADAVATHGPFHSPFDLWMQSHVCPASIRALARADAFRAMGLDRRQALWHAQRLHGDQLPLLDPLSPANDTVTLPRATGGDEVLRDYQMTGLSLKAHPISFLRDRLTQMGALTAEEVKDANRSPFGRTVAVAGIVLFRQRPGTAKGVMFMTLEDETARVDLIVRTRVTERFRDAAIYGKVVLARGRVERRGKVVHVLVTSFRSLDDLANQLPHLSRDFR